jgi:CBS domain-containing protein
MNAQDLMTADPATVSTKTTVAEAWDVMREMGIRHLPVVDGSTLVGMLSDRDFARMAAEEFRRGLATEVVRLMSADVITVGPETDLGDVVDVFIENRVGAVPVVTSGGELTGIVSYLDVLRVVRDTLEDA